MPISPVCIEQEILELATISSAKTGWKSELSGLIGIVDVDDDDVQLVCNSENEYVCEILTFVNNLNETVFDADLGIEVNNPAFESAEARDFDIRASKCDRNKLVQLAKDDWANVQYQIYMLRKEKVLPM